MDTCSAFGLIRSLGHLPNRIAPGVELVGPPSKVSSLDKNAGAIIGEDLQNSYVKDGI